MEIKRLVLAIAVSCVIFIGWNYLAKEMGWLPPPPEPATQNATTAPLPTVADIPGDPSSSVQEPLGDPSATRQESPGDPSAVRQPDFVSSPGRLVTVDTPLYTAVFHSGGGVLRQFFLKEYHTAMRPDAPKVNMITEAAAAQGPMGVLIDGLPTWTGTPWTLEGDDIILGADASGVLRLVADINGLRVVRELIFSGSNYVIEEKIRLTSPDPKAVKLAFTFGASALAVEAEPSIFSRLRYAIFGGEAPVASENQYNLTRVAWLQDGKFDDKGMGSDLTAGHLVQGKVSWMAVMDNYFMGAVSMPGAEASAKGRMTGNVFHVLIGKSTVPVSSEETTLNCAYFIGPKDGAHLKSAPNNIEKALDYGFFSIVAKPLVFLLQFLYGYVQNYGVAIILMTVLIKILFWPLSRKSYKSMQQMKQLQPLITKIRTDYADDKEAMNREVMQLYKTYKVNPAGGCLPILVQIPVFFGLYQALLNAIELRQAPFISTLPFTDHVWLADLASPDPFLITPLVMGATMFLQQKMTPASGDPTQAKVMMLMPVVFTALFINFPSGLVLYWLVNNVISIAQQWMQLREPAK